MSWNGRGLLTQLDVHDDVEAWSSCVSSQVSRSVPLSQISYMDDIALPLQASCPLELLEKVTSATEILDRHLISHNLRLNFKPGKTEAVLQLRGPASKEAGQVITSLGERLSAAFQWADAQEWSLVTNISVCSSHRQAAWRWNFQKELPLRWVRFTTLCRDFSRLGTLRLLQKSRLSWPRLSPGSFCMPVFGIHCRLHKFASSTRYTCVL